MTRPQGTVPEQSQDLDIPITMANPDTLYLDIGNSRIKWSVYEGPASSGGAIERDEDWNRCAEDIRSGLPSLRIRANLRCSDPSFAQIKQAFARHFSSGFAGIEPCSVETDAVRLRLAYDNPGLLGPDRWCALVAAQRRYPGEDLLVIDAGSAWTADLLGGDGEHLGGYIIPGPPQMIDSCARLTRLPLAPFPAGGVIDSARPGRDPVECVHRGLGSLINGFVGEIIENATRIFAERSKASAWHRGQTASPLMRVVLTGGAVANLNETPLPGHTVHIPDLVLDGLRIIDTAPCFQRAPASPEPTERIEL